MERSKLAKIIAHIDMNSYYASVEQQANPALRGKPVCIGGKAKGTAVISASVEAKRYGIKTGFTVYEAMQRYPGVIMVPVDFIKYSDVTDRFLEIFSRFTPRVEPFSLDEAFLDLTGVVKSFEEAATLANKIKVAIQTEIGERITCSVGLADNKVMAKLGSDLRKPDGLVVIRPEDYKSTLDKVEFMDICGIGHRISRRLNNLGIFTFGSLRRANIALLVSEFGKFRGHWLHNLANGLNTEMISMGDRSKFKSMSHAETLLETIDDPDLAQKYLRRLSDRLAVRLRRKELKCRVVGAFFSSSKHGEGPKTAPWGQFGGYGDALRLDYYTSQGFDIWQTASRIMEKMFVKVGSVRYMSVYVQDLMPLDRVNLNIFGYGEKQDSLLASIDQVNSKYGKNMVMPASQVDMEVQAGFFPKIRPVEIRSRLAFNAASE